MTPVPNDPFPEYEQFDGIGLAKLIADGEVSAEQLSLAAQARLDARNPTINAVTYAMPERALKDARTNKHSGIFAGVPFLLKDLTAEDEGEICTWGNKSMANWRADFTSTMVNRYRDNGLVILGRTNTPECGIYNVTEPELFGPTRNPWDLSQSAGGSSGGSAAAVAAGIVPMAHASDGGGSIRIPASYCGLFGLKPSRGRTPCGPKIGEVWGGLSQEHVLSRSVRDSAAMLDCSQGIENGAPYQIAPPAKPYLSEIEKPVRKLKIAWTSQALFGTETDKECIKALEHSVQLAKSLGHDVVQDCPNFDKSALTRAYLLLVSAGVASDIEEISRRSGRKPPKAKDFEPATWMLKVISDNVSASEFQHHRVLVQQFGYQIADFFTQYDVFLTPTTAKTAPNIGQFSLSSLEKLQLALLRKLPLKVLLESALNEMSQGPMAYTPNTMLFNLTGQPAMSVPLWWSAAGMPVGTQWVGRFGDEATLFQLAAQLEQAEPWFNKRPVV